MGVHRASLLWVFAVSTAACGSSPPPSRPAPIASAIVAAPPPAPTAAPSTAPSEASPAPPAASAAVASSPCRGGRLGLGRVEARCVADATADALPPELKAEVHGPGEMKAGEEGSWELRLVNQSSETLSFAFSISCKSHVYATDERGAEVIRHESTSMGQTLVKCDAPSKVVKVVLEPGGMLFESLSWSAITELYRDDKRIYSKPLAPGKYTLKVFTWFRREPQGASRDAPREGRHGVYQPITAELPIVVIR